MKPGMTVDASGLLKSLKGIRFTQSDMLNIEGAGARVQVNGQRQRVPVDSGATRASVNSHIVEANDTRIVDEIGPETDYAPVIEYGRRDMPNYPMQPFVRPAAREDFDKTMKAIGEATGQLVVSRWQT